MKVKESAPNFSIVREFVLANEPIAVDIRSAPGARRRRGRRDERVRETNSRREGVFVVCVRLLLEVECVTGRVGDARVSEKESACVRFC